MKSNLSIFALLLFSILFTGCLKKEEKEIPVKEISELRTTANDFMKSLKSVLVKEIQTNGIVDAVSVCSDTAQILTNNFGQEKGVIIRRVSSKNRNPLNKPDDFEIKALQRFEEWYKNGELLPQTELASVEEEDEKKFILYMKPIFIQPECLGCHGTENEIPDNIKLILNERYPEDKAVNFKNGDLRGAVSVKKEFK
jgi:hypothetical protein